MARACPESLRGQSRDGRVPDGEDLALDDLHQRHHLAPHVGRGPDLGQDQFPVDAC